MRLRRSSRCLSGVLVAMLVSPLVPLVPTAQATASPVFDDEHLTHTFLHGLAALASSDAILTGARAVDEVEATIGKGVTLPLASTPCHLGESKPLYDAVVPAVVAVSSVYKCERCSDWHLGGSGSGWIVSPDGLVVTNHHVIQREAGHRMGIMTADGEVYAITEVVAADPVGDAVVVRIDTRGRKLPFLALGASPDCGTEVSVVSHPVGRYWCLTEGVVSRFHRQQKATGDAIPAVEGASRSAAQTRATAAGKPVWMSITADYTIGSSGGPVFNASGEVVGMVSRTVTSSQTKPENANRRRPLAGETIVFKDCVSTETLHKLLSGHPQAAPADTAKR
jgi:S1-C subfamily serine protease